MSHAGVTLVVLVSRVSGWKKGLHGCLEGVGREVERRRVESLLE